MAHGVRPPPPVLPEAQKERKAPPAAGPAPDSAGHRQGHPHHPRDGVRGGGRAEPDDRLRHRRGAGGVRGGDQAAQHQQGIHSAPNAGGRRAGRRDCRAGKDARQRKAHPPPHRAGAGRRCRKIRHGSPYRHRGGRGGARPGAGGGDARLSRDDLRFPRGLFQEDHAAVAAHVRRAALQGGRRPALLVRDDERGGAARLLGPLPGL